MLMCASIAFVLAEIIGKFAGLLHFNHQPFAVLSNTNQLIEKAINNSFQAIIPYYFFILYVLLVI